MSTQIQITPASGITVGTTAITSGTVGRILFEGTGNVLQEDASLAWDNTLKRLTLKAVGVASTDIPFAIRNNTDTFNLFNINGLGRARFSFDSSNTDFISIEPQLSEISMSAYGGLKMMSMTNSQSFFGFGVASYKMGIGNNSPQARLDVRAQGALSTDIAFRVRNSADTKNLITIRGDKTIELIADTPATNGGISITSSAYNEPIINMYDSFGSKKLIIDTSNALIGVGGSGNIKIGSLTTTNSYLGLVTPTTNNRFLKLVDAFNNEYLSLGGNTYDGTGGISLTLKTTTTNGTNFVTFSRSNNTNPVVVSDLGYVGIGTATLGARLDIKAQGAAVTDLALRVRNSADTSNLFVVKGNGVLNAANLPTSAVGLVAGDIWNNLGILTIV